jgi:hypothetical protein
MSLALGSRVGPYEIVSALGAGGTGEVYRARDAKLNRDVALKILPDAFTLDGDRIARFRREAQVLASLNHPNVAATYGFEDSGPTHALVLELVEGPTLADRIAQGAVPLDDALPIARQIAEALEAAHEQGIMHRDLASGAVHTVTDVSGPWHGTWNRDGDDPRRCAKVDQRRVGRWRSGDRCGGPEWTAGRAGHWMSTFSVRRQAIPGAREFRGRSGFD